MGHSATLCGSCTGTPIYTRSTVQLLHGRGATLMELLISVCVSISSLSKMPQVPEVQLFAAYFPQWHQTPLNDYWFGPNFTDWSLLCNRVRANGGFNRWQKDSAPFAATRRARMVRPERSKGKLCSRGNMASTALRTTTSGSQGLPHGDNLGSILMTSRMSTARGMGQTWTRRC